MSKNPKTKENHYYKNYCNFNPLLFSKDLSDADWSDVYQAQNVNEAVDCFNFFS